MSKFELVGVDVVSKGFLYGARTSEEADALVKRLLDDLGTAAFLDIEVLEDYEDGDGAPIYFEIYQYERSEFERVLKEYENE